MFIRRKPEPRPPSPLEQLTVQLGRVPTWIRSAFGIQANAAPAKLVVPDVQPVLEVHQPVTVLEGFATPAAGVAVDWDVPLDESWELVSISFLFTTDATVANREVTAVILSRDGALTPFSVAANLSQAASLGIAYTFAALGVLGDLDAVGATQRVAIPAPVGLIVPGGGRFVFSATNLQAGDAFSAIAGIFRKWPT